MAEEIIRIFISAGNLSGIRGSKRKPGEPDEVRALSALNVYPNDYGICLAQKFIGQRQKGDYVLALKGNQPLFSENALSCGPVHGNRFSRISEIE